MQIFDVREQKRLFYRAKVTWPVTIETEKGWVEATLRDISAGGAHIHSNEPLLLSDPIHISIKAPDREPVKVVARVRWPNRPGESELPAVIGVSFIEISSEDQEFLQQVAMKQFQDKMTT